MTSNCLHDEHSDTPPPPPARSKETTWGGSGGGGEFDSKQFHIGFMVWFSGVCREAKKV